MVNFLIGVAIGVVGAGAMMALACLLAFICFFLCETLPELKWHTKFVLWVAFVGGVVNYMEPIEWHSIPQEAHSSPRIDDRTKADPVEGQTK